MKNRFSNLAICLLHSLEFRDFLPLGLLSLKAKEHNLNNYLTHNWDGVRLVEFFSKTFVQM